MDGGTPEGLTPLPDEVEGLHPLRPGLTTYTTLVTSTVQVVPGGVYSCLVSCVYFSTFDIFKFI